MTFLANILQKHVWRSINQPLAPPVLKPSSKIGNSKFKHFVQTFQTLIKIPKDRGAVGLKIFG